MKYNIKFDCGNNSELTISCETKYGRKLVLEGLFRNMQQGQKVFAHYSKDNEISILINLANVNFIYCIDEE